MSRCGDYHGRSSPQSALNPEVGVMMCSFSCGCAHWLAS